MINHKIKWSKQSLTDIKIDKGGFDEENMPTIVNTPLGTFDVNNSLNPYYMFDMWMGNCNFDITPEVLDILDSTIGIETLVVISRYRFLIGVGELFDCEEVKNMVEQFLCCDEDIIFNKEVEEKVNNLKVSLDTKYKYWSIYVFPNGKIISNGSNTLTAKYKKFLSSIREAKLVSSGILIESDV